MLFFRLCGFEHEVAEFIEGDFVEELLSFPCFLAIKFGLYGLKARDN